MVFVATICFSLMSATVKYLSYLPLMEVIFFRHFLTMLIVPLMLKNRKIPFQGNNQSILLLRCLFGVFAMIAYFYTLSTMTLTDAVGIRQLSPFIIILLAGIFLKEKIISQQIPIFILAFLGTLLIVKPGLRLDILPAIIALLGAVLTAGSHVTIRHLRLTDHPLVIVNYVGYTSGVLAFLALLVQGNFYIPNIDSLFLLILFGLIGLIGQIAITKAYQLAPTNIISLYLYLQIIFVAIFGIIFFKEIPDLFSIFGAFLIIISGYLYYKLNIKTN